jgi:hypothetical protein
MTRVAMHSVIVVVPYLLACSSFAVLTSVLKQVNMTINNVERDAAVLTSDSKQYNVTINDVDRNAISAFASILAAIQFPDHFEIQCSVHQHPSDHHVLPY